ncbi:MAG: hypothetical protein ABSB57_01805 [Dehalococcoidia bacterium]
MGTKSNRGRLRQLFEPFVTQALRLPKWDDYERIKDLPEFEALSAFIQREAATGKTGASKAGAKSKKAMADANHRVWQLYLLPLLERCSEAKFDDVYTPLEQYLCAGQVSWTATWQEVAPLPGFAAQSWPVELPNGVTIRELKAAERRRLGDIAWMLGPMKALEWGLAAANFVMSWWQPGPNAPPRTADNDFDTVVTALRLLKPGAVWYNVRGHWPGHPAFGSNPALGTASWEPKPGVDGARYELLEQDVEPLSDLVASLVNGAQHERLPVALDRFKLAYERRRPEDKLIDYWIALEALFSPPDSREVTYRIALRAAYFIASLPEEREQVFTALRDHYGTRSDVVHGRKPKRDVKVAAEAVDGYLRQALRKIVSDPARFRPDQLDLVVARGQFEQGAK